MRRVLHADACAADCRTGLQIKANTKVHACSDDTSLNMLNGVHRRHCKQPWTSCPAGLRHGRKPRAMILRERIWHFGRGKGNSSLHLTRTSHFYIAGCKGLAGSPSTTTKGAASVLRQPTAWRPLWAFRWPGNAHNTHQRACTCCVMARQARSGQSP